MFKQRKQNNAMYVVGIITLGALSLSACGARTAVEQTQIEHQAAQQALSYARPACRDHVQYLVYSAGPYTAITPRLHTDGFPYTC